MRLLPLLVVALSALAHGESNPEPGYGRGHGRLGRGFGHGLLRHGFGHGRGYAAGYGHGRVGYAVKSYPAYNYVFARPGRRKINRFTKTSYRPPPVVVRKTKTYVKPLLPPPPVVRKTVVAPVVRAYAPVVEEHAYVAPAPPPRAVAEVKTYEYEEPAPVPVVSKTYEYAQPAPPPVVSETYEYAEPAPPPPPVVSKSYEYAEPAPPPPPVVSKTYEYAEPPPPPPPVVSKSYEYAEPAPAPVAYDYLAPGPSTVVRGPVEKTVVPEAAVYHTPTGRARAYESYDGDRHVQVHEQVSHGLGGDTHEIVTDEYHPPKVEERTVIFKPHPHIKTGYNRRFKFEDYASRPAAGAGGGFRGHAGHGAHGPY